jgi:hypothetical protein
MKPKIDIGCRFNSCVYFLAQIGYKADHKFYRFIIQQVLNLEVMHG